MITSPQNDKLKEIRRLQRHPDDRFVAEGEDLVAAAEQAGWPPVYRLVAGVDVDPALLDAVSGLGSGTRIIGVYERRYAAPAGPLCVALWGVRDPGNVGAVLRSALAFGAASVALGPDCADPFGPKAVRASMGAIFVLPVARVDDPADLPGARIGLAARTGAPLTGPLDGPVTIVVGAERTGLPDDVLAACDAVAHIPIASESLNAAMAATVGLYEVTRGRAPATAGQVPAADTRTTAAADTRATADPGASAATAAQDPTPDTRTTADPGASAATAAQDPTPDTRTTADPGASTATAAQDPTPGTRTTADPGAVADVLAEPAPPASNPRIARVGAS
jgi:TrmH family RNA methyltransferase